MRTSTSVIDYPYEIRKKYGRAIKEGLMAGYETPGWRHTFIGAFLTRYPDRVSVLLYFKETTGHIPRWKDMTDWILEDFTRTIQDRMCQSSARTVCQQVKAVLNAHRDEVKFPSRNYAKILSFRKEPSQAVFLTEDEVSALDKYEPQDEKERATKRIFMIEALTGARHSDAERLAPENIDRTSDCLRYVPEKTRSCVISVPVHKWLEKYLKEETIPLGLSTFNSTLRGICRKCGINGRVAIFRRGKNTTGEKWEYVSSHTGRRTFATNLFLRNTDISIIQRFMGHSEPKITWGYICAQKEINENVMSFFKNEKNN